MAEKQTNKGEFITSIEESLANAIRRSANEIPILAIDEVEFHKNDSALFDEIIAHRLGLIPLITEKTFVDSKECSCDGKGCAKCSVDLKLEAKGPCTVYSKELKGKAKPVFENTPIIILNKDQELVLIARAKLGRGIEHTKFSPGIVYYKNLVDIKINRECDNCERCINICPQKVLRSEGRKITINDIERCDFCLACVEECKEHGRDSIKIEKTDKIKFFIESFGQITTKDIITEAAKALKANLKELKKIK